MKEIISESIDKTKNTGKRLGKLLKKGDFIALIGELGSGKTVFVKGLSLGIGVKNDRYVNSPTFVIIKEYCGKGKKLYHFDIYRLGDENLLREIGAEEYFFGNGITAMEWADKAMGIIPKERLDVKFSVINDIKRKIKFIPHGEKYKKIVKKLLQAPESGLKGKTLEPRA